jgi:mannose-1-phosphate guanylyltransferase
MKTQNEKKGHKMNIILLSGGSGKRLWPLSNDIRSKQFIKLFDNGHGELESMVQRMYHGIKTIDKDADITIATSKSQVSELKNQLGDNLSISVEPCRRDTFPAIALAVSYLHDVKKVSLDEAVVICPVDPYVEDDYFKALVKLYELASNDDSSLSLMGIEPTYPSEKYGYIIPKTKDQISNVLMFKEKPTVEAAKGYIEEGALWNAGIFAFKIGYLLDKAHLLIEFKDYHDLFNKYESLNKISFDYAIVEKEKSINVLRFAGKWADLGTWNTLTESMAQSNLGNVIIGDGCDGTHVINTLDIPVFCMGTKNLIVAASPEGVLVTDKGGSSKIKPYIDKIEAPIMFAEKSWGEYRVVDVEPDSLTIKVTLNSGHHMSYHSHARRDETWTIVSGSGLAIIDGKKKPVISGSIITIKAGTKHSIVAKTNLKIIEVQIGKDIDAKDKIKFDYFF